MVWGRRHGAERSAFGGANAQAEYCIAVRIAHVVPRGERPSSGVLTVIAHLAAAFAQRGHDVEVWRLHPWSAEVYSPVRTRLEDAGVVDVSALETIPIRRVGAATRNLAASRSVDVVHLHGGFNPSNTAIARRLRTPYVFSPHSAYDTVSLRRHRLRKLAYRAAFERSMVRRAAGVVALTSVEATDVATFIPGVACDVIPNGVSISARPGDASAVRRELGLADADRLAVFVGRLDVHRKGLDRLVDAIAAAPGWTACLVGPEFRDVAALRLRIQRNGARGRVVLAGERHGAALATVVAAADVFVLPSRWEGMPMALLEALALGTPAVVSGRVEAAVPVAASSAGWVFEGEGNDLARVLRIVAGASGPELASRSDAARALASRYDWLSIAKQYESVYGRATVRDPVRR
jgi:glycosyltransferase involved in cell wall biosynthesis